MNMDLYESFVKKIHIGIPKVEPEQKLLESFNRVNEKYFFGMMNIPNIVWGDHSIRKLGSYDYKRDSITISRILEKNETFLDMTMYHELLHKKHKFSKRLSFPVPFICSNCKDNGSPIQEPSFPHFLHL